MVVCENTDLHKRLWAAVKNTPPKSLLPTPELLRPTQAELATGKIEQSAEFLVERVIDRAHFVAKEDAPLLQIADACAFGFRRYFSGLSYGDDFVRLMLGQSLIAEDWAGNANMGTFYVRKRK